MTLDNQRAISDLLRSADKSIKEGNLDNALAAISKVFEFDQRNVYARAYQERILSLKEMRLAARLNAEKIPADSEKHVQESDFAQPKAVPRAPNAGVYAPALSVKSTPPAPSPAAVHQQPAVVSPPAPAATPAPEHGSSAILSPEGSEYMKHAPARLKAYRALLAEIWTVGTFTDAEEQRVSTVRQSFAITDDEHKSIEREIRFAAYLAAIEIGRAHV